jgi:pSer/pThr/pTyr-binding forkhead associated (FHA) protein
MKSFLNACGFREPLRLIIDSPRAVEGEPRTLPQPFAVIGRDPRADVILDDLRVSRRHVYIQAVAGQVFWVDLESRTGTCDEAGTRKSGWLAGGGLLEVGPFVIRRAAGDASAGDLGLREPGRESPLAVRGYGREPLPEVALEFLNGPSESTVWPMNRVMSLIGSAKGCKFRLTDPSVSAFHASLLRTAAGLWVVDLRGGRSISINSEPVRFGPLADDDVLGIGRYRMRIRCRESRPGARDSAGKTSSGLPAHRVFGGLARRSTLEPSPGPLPAPSALAGPPLPMPPLPMPLSPMPLSPMPPSPFPVVASAAPVELVPPESAPHGRLHPDVTESVLVPLVNQFSMMQQQMFDQFQQAMGMLVQMFGTMHREQMDVIREELDRLHDLTRELQELKEELAKSPGRATPSTEPATAPTSARAPALPASGAPAGSAGAPWGRAGTAPADAPSTETPIRSPAAGQRRPLGPLSAPPPPPMAPRPDQSPPGGGSSSTAGAPVAAGTGQDAVAWIHQRIAAIQHERETRWQRILKLLPGMS